MRKSQLRQHALRILHEDNRGSIKEKKYRYFVVHKMIDDLFALGEVPVKWHALTSLHIKHLINYWAKKNIPQTTILKYISVIRWFLKAIQHSLPDLDNHNLGVLQQYSAPQSRDISLGHIEEISESTVKLLLKLQIFFGMTLSEGLRFLPELHYQDNTIWLTRNITFNSHDRLIPLRTEQQQDILTQLIDYLGWQHTLISLKGYQAVCYAYNSSLKSIGFNPRDSYRYLYAHYLNSLLSPTLTKKEISSLLLREMGLKSRTTIWTYLKQYSSNHLGSVL